MSTNFIQEAKIGRRYTNKEGKKVQRVRKLEVYYRFGRGIFFSVHTVQRTDAGESSFAFAPGNLSVLVVPLKRAKPRLLKAIAKRLESNVSNFNVAMRDWERFDIWFDKDYKATLSHFILPVLRGEIFAAEYS
jgi:hypothetical protein